jgi:nucleotide-binding universal stress UspA family protein
VKRFKSIVVATDLSPESLGVVSYAAHLAQAQEARLTIVHAAAAVSLANYTHFVPKTDLDAVDQRVAAHAREALEKWVKRHVHKPADAEIVVAAGITDEVICEAAQDADADLLVVSSHGRDGLSRLVMGSVAERVIREAPCPVLVVKPPRPVIDVSSEPKRAARKKPSRKKTKTAKTRS